MRRGRKKALLQHARAVASRAIVHDDLTTSWLEAHGLLAIPEESAIHFDEDSGGRLEAALASLGIEQLCAVLTEWERPDDDFVLQCSSEELIGITMKNGALDYLLVDVPRLRVAVYCSVDYETLLVAGSRELLVAYFGDLGRAAAEYWTFSETYLEEMAGTEATRDKLRTYLRHADWVERRLPD